MTLPAGRQAITNQTPSPKIKNGLSIGIQPADRQKFNWILGFGHWDFPLASCFLKIMR